MNKYFPRCIEADWPTLVNLGVLLGVLQHTPESSEQRVKTVTTLVSPGDEGFDPELSDEPYEETVPHPLGETETIITPAHTWATEGGAWDFIGPIHRPTGEVDDEGVPLTEPLTDPEGNVYWHANLLTPIDLRARAEALAAERPEVAAALADVARFFPVDENGQPRAPSNPYRVFL
jgi:hypothetical protein